MPRYARQHVPGAVYHFVSRTVNREFRIHREAERVEYLRRLADTLEDTDWTLLAYGIMSNHPHLAARAGNDPAACLILPTHAGFAQWLNRREGRSGPVFAQRFMAKLVPDEQVGRLIAYIHNNPVRARVVADALDSKWTSHRSYLGVGETPGWLAVDEGLRLSGFDSSPAGRRAFASMVRERSGDPRLAAFADEPAQVRVRARREVNVAVRVSSGRVTTDGEAQSAEIFIARSAAARPRWGGDVADVLEQVAQHVRLPLSRILGPSRAWELVDARALAMAVWVYELGRPQSELAAALGVGSSTASRLLRRNDRTSRKVAREVSAVAEACWAGYGITGEFGKIRR
jgi:REP element-mobilizing transposase RayT